MSALDVLENLEKGEVENISRREFLRFCGRMAVLLGLSSTAIPEIAKAIEKSAKDGRPSVIWLNFQDCAGNTESFTRANAPSVGEAILEHISLDYHEVLMAAAGHQAEERLHEVLNEYSGEIIVVVEGAIPTKDNGIYCTVAGRTAVQILKEIEPHALAFVAVGTCAAFGGIPKANPNPTGAVGVEKIITSKPVINVPGCPANPDVIMATLVHYVLFGRLPELDAQNRPKFAFGKKIHDSCERRPHYDAGQFVLSFDDYGAKQGYCLYKVGCKGPVTYNVCAAWRWNMNASWPVKSGHPCIGCSERDFWDRYYPFYEHIPKTGGFGVEAKADDIGKVALGLTALTVGAHALYTASVKAAEKFAEKITSEGSKVEKRESTEGKEGGRS